MRSPRNRRGMALGVVLLAIVIISILILGAYLSNIQEYQVGRNTLTQNRALSAAEHGEGAVYSNWDRGWNTFRAGTTFVRAWAPGDGSVDTTRITKLNALSFLVVSEGAAGTGARAGARRRTGTLMRLNVPKVSMLGAITTRGTVRIGGSTTINGRDTTYAGWDCPPAGAPVAGAVVPSFSNLQSGGTCGPTYSCIQGVPLVSATLVAADTNTYFSYGDQKWPDLIKMADHTVSGTWTGIRPTYRADGSCNTGDPGNYGDPARNSPTGKCESYFPVIYAPGDLTINGNVGQGLLLVGGNLNIQGGFTYFGQVIARGTVKLTGTGNHINGSILAASVVDSTASSMLGGNSTIRFSRCAVVSALRNTALPVKAPQRSWIELF